MQDRTIGAVPRSASIGQEPHASGRAEYGQIGIIAIVYAVTALVFYFDITINSPLAAGVLYIPLVLTATQFRNKSALWVFTAIACLLTIAGYFLPHLATSSIALTNRSLSLGVIALTALLVRDQQNGEERLKAATMRAAAAELTKTQLLRNASQEFRNSLNAVMGFTDLLKSDCRQGQRDALGAIEQGGQRLLDTVENLIDLTASEEDGPRLGSVDLKTVLESATAKARTAAAERDIVIVWDPPHDGVPPGLGDEWAMHRILDNLLRNAVRFSPVGGRVRIKLQRKGSAATIEIADNGRGMRPEMIEKLGEPILNTGGMTGRDSDGLGIGLALSFKLAQLTKGEIEIASQPGRGTTVTVSLPLAASIH